MKRAYGEYVFSKNLDVLLYMTDDERRDCITAWLMHLGAFEDETDTALVEAIFFLQAKVEKACRDGHCVHLFFKGEGFKEWLEGCGTTIAREQVSMFRSIAGDMRLNIDGGDSLNIMLHFQGGTSHPYLFNYRECAEIPTREGTYTGWLLCCFRGRKHVATWFSEGKEVYDQSAMSLISSALAYMKCFPDAVKIGIPDDLKHPAHYRGKKSKYIIIHPSLVVRDGPCPHYRIGHFRFLSSERFKHKRGMTVFVHGAFIKGKAKTVLSPEQCDAVAA